MMQCFVATSSVTVKKTDVVSARGLTLGAVVGIASAAFLIGLFVATVVLMFIFRYVGMCYLLFIKCKHSVLHGRINHFRFIFKTRTETPHLLCSYIRHDAQMTIIINTHYGFHIQRNMMFP